MKENANILTPRREAINLFQHGTRTCGLTARAILQAAESDILRRSENRRIRAERTKLRAELGKKGPALDALPRCSDYAFIPRHVNKALTAADLLRLAIEDMAGGRTNAKHANTLRVYESEELLRAALQLVSH